MGENHVWCETNWVKNNFVPGGRTFYYPPRTVCTVGNIALRLGNVDFSLVDDLDVSDTARPTVLTLASLLAVRTR